MRQTDPHTPFQHPAVSAALSMRNAIAAEMAVAGRAGHDPTDSCWLEAEVALLHPEHSTWVLASDAYAQMREDLECVEPTPMERLGKHVTTLAALAVPLPGNLLHAGKSSPEFADKTHSGAAIPRPAARRRRERLTTIFWFAVGGFGGLLLACAVRVIEMAFLWR